MVEVDKSVGCTGLLPSSNDQANGMSSIRAPGQFTPLPNPVPHIQTEVCFGRGKDIMVHGAMLPDADGYYCCRSMGEGLNRPCFKALKDIDLAQHVSCSNILCKFALPSSSSCSSLSPPLLLPSLLSLALSLVRLMPCISSTHEHCPFCGKKSWLINSFV